MSSSIVLSVDELRAQRKALLDKIGITYDELERRAQAYSLRPEERAVWESIRSIDYLLDDGVGQ